MVDSIYACIIVTNRYPSESYFTVFSFYLHYLLQNYKNQQQIIKSTSLAMGSYHLKSCANCYYSVGSRFVELSVADISNVKLSTGWYDYNTRVPFTRLGHSTPYRVGW